MNIRRWAVSRAGSSPGKTAGKARRALVARGLLALSTALAACGSAESPDVASRPDTLDRLEGPDRSDGPATPVRIVASIFPIADLARQVGGERVDVRVLLRAGASPATFDATPDVIRRIQGARLFLLVGGGLDSWAEELRDAVPGATAEILLEGLDLRGRGETGGTGNPHVWLDPIRTRDELLPRISRALARVAPEGADDIAQRSLELADSLTGLDREIRKALRDLRHRTFVASHAAWTYFAERYALTALGAVHEHPGQEPSPRSLADLVDRARAASVPVVFSEPQLPDAAARALAAELEVPVLSLDPLGGTGVEGRNSYLSLMRYNTAQFVRGLDGILRSPQP